MDITVRKALVAHFITRCNEYAERKLEQYRAELPSASPAEALAIQDKIGHWTAYRAFNEHTLHELATPKLDDWLE